MRHVDNPNPARDPVPAPHWSVVLRALRIASGISQEGWAARLGYGRRTIQRWEHAELAPDAAATDALVGLCADYGLFREHRNGVLSGRTLNAYGLCAMLAEARVDGSGVQTTAAELAPAKGLQLPAALTTFIGRDQEISALLRLLSTTRLLTLTGPGGAGKTRLALEVARLASIDFPDGVRVIELASIAESEIVPQAVATVLGIREQPGRLVLATLAERLSDRKLLILLDNCEHV
ncbi:MAG: helix-turn-helix domain-containing protein, partial [Candidatus Dormibacteraeota bacterium]|nr:helix-turn-helix domain-containing protein [Candidatus Dormibacteraeota bacterium]